MFAREAIWGRGGVMVSFYTSFENIFAANLSLIRLIEPVIDDNHSEIHGLVPPNVILELISR